MKIINFTAIEILPALLSKKKTQTIRPAWKEYEDNKGIEFLKPPRFKVGEQVKLMWNQRSKHKLFWLCCGKPFLFKEQIMHYCDKSKEICMGGMNFNKLLGKAEITEVFEIEMGFGNAKGVRPVPYIEDEHGRWYVTLLDYALSKMSKKLQQINNGRKLYAYDGFSSAEKLFKYFDKAYDLSNPKEFYVYRWIWK